MSRQEVVIGNCLDVLRKMDSESIDLCVTSPPYWALRDYQSEPVVWGGDPNCSHSWEEHRESARGGTSEDSMVGANRDAAANNRGHPTITQYCTVCGAWKGQLGLEPSPYEYIEHLISIFDEVKRVLKPSGSCWVNIGDTYSGTKKGNTDVNKNNKVSTSTFCKQKIDDIPDKSLVQIPSRFAIAMTDHGWILRNECIWQKPNVMPQSMTDRFTVDFEKFFFFTKEPRYYFKQQTEPLKCPDATTKFSRAKDGNPNRSYSGRDYDANKLNGERNKRTIWSIPTVGSHEDHVAMYPKTLIDTPIKACCPQGGKVLDPFCGSGTTLQYCFEHNIDAIGIEIRPAYEEIIKRKARIGQSRLAVVE